jgi:two-component system phosphate regulon response regulator PhoB
MTQKKIILVVEDDDTSRAVLCAMLTTLGYDYVSFSDPREVIDQLNGRPIDLGLIDLMMPHMGGLELLKQLREIEVYRLIPLFMITARDAEDDVLDGYKHGVDYYITKPYTTKQLQYGIDLYLSKDSE